MNGKPAHPRDGLQSDAPSDRARAASWLVQHPNDIAARELMQALQAETVPRLRRTLVQVLEMRQRSQVARDSSRGAAERSGERAIVSDKQVDIAALIRHELSPAVGWIRLAAEDEVLNFASSATNDAVRKLRRRIDGLVAIVKASEQLNLQRVSLPHVLLDNWPDPQTSPELEPSTSDSTVDIATDEGLFSILLSNVFQNAIDASLDAADQPNVQISWGYTDLNYWVRITNPFNGERFVLDDVLAVGSTSKMAHQGQGLALVLLVAERLGISVTLEGRSGVASLALSGTRPHD